MSSGQIHPSKSVAQVLRAGGAEVHFISRELPGSCHPLVAASGIDVQLLPSDLDTAGEAERLPLGDQAPDWLVVDHYALDWQWESRLRPFVGNILAIDDLADRRHDCDALLDQNLYAGMADRYYGLVPAACHQLLGPSYALLRSEFLRARQQSLVKDGVVRRVLVTFGGSDPTNETEKTLLALRMWRCPEVAVDVVVGGSAPRAAVVQALCERLPNVTFHCNVSNIAELMLAADLALGAGGATTWERCCLALPSLLIAVAENQIEIARTVAEVGAAFYLGESRQVSAADIKQSLEELLKTPKKLRQTGQAAASLVDGAGAERVAAVLCGSTEGRS